MSDDRSPASDDALRSAYDAMRAMARSRIRMHGPTSIEATELAHEAWLRLHRKGEADVGRGHFLVYAARVVRDTLVERAREKATRKRGGEWTRVDWDSAANVALDHPEELLLVNDALSRLEAEDAETAQVVVLRFFAGLTGDETAEALGLSPTTVDRRWSFARARLRQYLTEE